MYFLPIVKPEISASLEREVWRHEDDFYIFSQLLRLDEENPIVGQWIRRFMKTTDDPIGSAMCAIITYRMLESQSEANMMNLEYNLD